MPATSRHVLLLRHGESVWNAEGRWQGQADPPLSALGEEQTRDAADRLVGGDPFVTVVASDLQRARRTGEILADLLGLELRIDTGLREIDVGDWTGLTRAEIDAGWAGELAAWSEGRSESTPGGETRAHLTGRARATMLRLAAEAAPGDRLLLVSHGALIRNLDRLLGLEPRGIGNLVGRWYEANGDGALSPGDLVSLCERGTGRPEAPQPSSSRLRTRE